MTAYFRHIPGEPPEVMVGVAVHSAVNLVAAVRLALISPAAAREARAIAERDAKAAA